MSLFKWKLAKKRLDSLEEDLIKKISDTNDESLMNIFSIWQNQRNICNDEFLKYFENELKKTK